MNANVRKHLVRFLVYPAFFSACFAVMLLVCFPYGALRDRIESEARTQGIPVRIGALKLTWMGFEAKGVELGLFKPAEGREEAEPLRIDSLEIFPRVLPLGVHVRAKLLGGRLDAAVDAGAQRQVKLRASSLQLSRLPPEALGDLVLSGELSLLADLKPVDQDFAKTEGRVAILGNELLIMRGSVQGFTLPRIDLGRLEVDAALSGGKTRMTVARMTGVDLIASAEGDIKQARKFSMSSPNMTLNFQPGEEFLKKNRLIASALGLAVTKDSEGFYHASLKGTLASPKLTPQKGKRR